MKRIGLVLAFAAVAASRPVAQTPAPPATEIYLAPFVEGEKKTTQIGIITIERSGVSVGKAVNITNNPGYDNQPCFLPDSSGPAVFVQPRRQAERHLPLRHGDQVGDAAHAHATEAVPGRQSCRAAKPSARCAVTSSGSGSSTSMDRTRVWSTRTQAESGITPGIFAQSARGVDSWR